MKVKFVDLSNKYDTTEIDSMINAGQFMGCEDFEKKFAKYHGVKHCVGVGSGTDALVFALLAAGVGPGDEVIVPANTYIATAFAVSHTGAQPVFCDVDPDTYVMTVDTVTPVITNKTKVIIPVHLYGEPVDVDAIKGFKIMIIEDCAQATGAVHSGKRVGTFAKAGCFSFYPTKNLGGLGQGGAVITNDDKLAGTIRSLGNVGRKNGSWYGYDHVGFNSRLDAINAKFLEAGLKELDHNNNVRRAMAEQYEERLEDIDEIIAPPMPIFSTISPVFHLYEIRLPDKQTRDSLKKHLENNGVGTGLHYPIPCHKQSVYVHLNANCPNAELLADTLLSLPMHSNLTSDEVIYVCDKIKEFFNG